VERYSNSFEPLLLEGHTARLFGTDLPTDGLNVVCKAVGALPEYEYDFGALTAATWDRDNEVTDLEMGTYEMSQMRVRVIDDFKLQIKHPSSVQQWRTLRASFYLNRWPIDPTEDFLKEYLFKASEFFIWEDITPRFDLYSDLARATSKVVFSGWRFKLEKVATPGRFVLWLNSWPPGT